MYTRTACYYSPIIHSYIHYYFRLLVDNLNLNFDQNTIHLTALHCTTLHCTVPWQADTEAVLSRLDEASNRIYSQLQSELQQWMVTD